MLQRLWLVLALSASTQACLPLLVPPMRARASIGPTAGRLADGRDANSEPNVQVSGAVHPLQAVKDLYGQPFDVGLGWGLDAPAKDGPGAIVHGPELELGYYPFRTRNGKNDIRLGAFTAGELLFSETASGAPGYGGTLGVNLELTGFSQGKLQGDGLAGGYVGTWGVGVFAAASHRSVGEASYVAAVLGLSVRVPFLGGIACCADASDIDLPSSSRDDASSDDDDSSRDEDSPSRSDGDGDDPRSERRVHRDDRVERTPASPRPSHKLERTPASPRPAP